MVHAGGHCPHVRAHVEETSSDLGRGEEVFGDLQRGPTDRAAAARFTKGKDESPTSRARPLNRSTVAPTAFLNVPYDRRYVSMYLAAIAGLCGLGLRPRATIEIPTSQRRLTRIFRLLTACRYSFHDLSRVSLSGGVPRFNMPFELGLAVATSGRRRHNWFVLEGRRHRLQRSLSDLNGTDPLIHDGTPQRLLQVLADVFDRPREPAIPLGPIYDLLRRQAPKVRARYGSIYTRGAFVGLVAAATELANELRERALA